MSKVLYVNNTFQDIRALHDVIREAIKNGGIFPEDYADIFQLVRTPDDSEAEWTLELKD